MKYQIRKAEIDDFKQIQILINKLCEKEFNEFDNTIKIEFLILMIVFVWLQ